MLSKRYVLVWLSIVLVMVARITDIVDIIRLGTAIRTHHHPDQVIDRHLLSGIGTYPGVEEGWRGSSSISGTLGYSLLSGGSF